MRTRILFLALLASQALPAQTPAARKKLLVVGEEKGYRHEAVSHAMATVSRLGRETGIWDAMLRTDTEALTKKKLEYNAKNLNDFDAVLFYTGGTLEMDDQQKADFFSFIHDDGKGFIGIHSAAITCTKWPNMSKWSAAPSTSIPGAPSTRRSWWRTRPSRAWRNGPRPSR